MMVRWRSNTSDVNTTGGSQRWLITVTVQLTSLRMVVRKSVDNTHGIACAIVVPSASMRVQNYAGTEIKRGSC